MKKIHSKNICYLLLADLIWGAAFVAQRIGGDATGPYTFNCIRSFLGCVVLLPLIWFRAGKQNDSGRCQSCNRDRKNLLRGGVLCGAALGFASNLQQLGITIGSSVGKAGFLTACYILLVPVLGIFLRKKVQWNVWLGVFFAVVGLYLLCITDGYAIEKGDILLLLCAFAFAVQILCIDHFAPKVDPVELSCVEFLVCGICSAFPMCAFEISSGISEWCEGLGSINVWVPILYAGICSSGIGYTLQIAGQRNFNPTIASLIMSLESVFSAIFGCILLNETMRPREILGCGVIFAAVILAQVKNTTTTASGILSENRYP